MEHNVLAYERNNNQLNSFTADGCIFVPISIFNTDDDRTKLSQSNAVTRCLELNLTKNDTQHTKLNRRVKTRKKKK